MRNQGGRGRGTKRKAETNFVDAYSGASELAPPPASRDVFAVPAKLRKIMKLKSMVTAGGRNDGQRDARPARESEKKTNKVRTGQVATKAPDSRNVTDLGVKGTRDASNGRGTELKSESPDQPAEKKKRSFASKWKKGEEELKRLVEKMDKREKTGIKHGFSDRRKGFLQEKKKKRKGKMPDADAVPALNQYEKVEFGDTVQAPPRLSFPKKAAEVKKKVKLRDDQAVMREKMRLAAIESYRKRKESSSSGVQHLRVLNFGLEEKSPT
ncbi:unnamed protein product [Calypogeia fissa]